MHVADFGAPAGGEDQELDDAAVIIVAASAPDCSKLGIAEHPAAAIARCRSKAADCCIALGEAHLHAPSQECTKRTTRPCCRRAAALARDHHRASSDILAV